MREQLKQNIEDKFFWCDIPYIEEPVMKLSDVKSIIDDFESRTCENCNHWDYKGWCTNTGMEYPLQIPTSKYFGCNRFERKES